MPNLRASFDPHQIWKTKAGRASVPRSASRCNPQARRLNAAGPPEPIVVSDLFGGHQLLRAVADLNPAAAFLRFVGTRARFGTCQRFLNEFGRIQLSSMPKGSPVTGPMRTQPVGRTSNAPTPMGGKLTNAPSPKQKSSTRTEAVRAAKAKITRRNSLRKQREALRD